MANTFLSQVGLPAYDPQAAPRGTVAATPMIENEADSAMVAMSDKLATKFGAMADRAAQIEGKRAGAIAGNDPNFRPTGSTTLRGYMQDQAGIDTYTSNLNAQLGLDMAKTYQQFQNDPAGFAAASAKLKAQYMQNHVFPEVAGEFNKRFTGLQETYVPRVLEGFQGQQKDQQRAAMVAGLDGSETARSQVIAAGTDPAVIRRQVGYSVADDEARIDALVASHAYTAEQGAKLKLAIRHQAATDVVMGEAGRLKNADDIDAYRQKLQQDFAAGSTELDADSFAKLDAGLQRLSKSVRVGDTQAASDLGKSLDELNEREANGYTPKASEWATLAMEAERVPGGRALFQEARIKSAFAAKIASQSPEASQAFIDGLKTQGRQLVVTPAAPTQAGREAYAMNYLISRGYPRVGAAGVVGNLIQESSMNPDQPNRGDGSDGSDSIGVGQWNSGRAIALRRFAAAQGKDYRDLGVQMAFLDHELSTDYAGVKEKLMAAKTADEAAGIIVTGYERPRGSEGGAAAADGWARRRDSARRLAGAEFNGTADAVPAGLDPADAKVLEWGQKLVDKKRKALSEDPVGVAASELGLNLAPFDPGSPDAPAQLAKRISQMDAFAQHEGRAPAYLRPDEKNRLTALLGQGGDPALGVMQQVVTGAGPAAPAVLKELGDNAPVLAQIGAILAAGGSTDAARDAMTGLKLKKDGGKLPEVPKTMMADTAEVMGNALSGNLEERERLTQVAGLIYATRMQRINGDPTTPAASAMYKRALQEAAGASFRGGQQFGGFIDWNDGIFGRHSMRGTVSVPADMSVETFTKTLDEMRPEDLQTLTVPPAGIDGQPFDPSILRQNLPVRTESGYLFGRPNPQTHAFEYIRGVDNRPFVLPLAALREIAIAQRVARGM